MSSRTFILEPFYQLANWMGLKQKWMGPSQSIFCNGAEVAITHKVINANLATNRNWELMGVFLFLITTQYWKVPYLHLLRKYSSHQVCTRIGNDNRFSHWLLYNSTIISFHTTCRILWQGLCLQNVVSGVLF
jgi:hypothetical protein